jgi:hypothetical protein
MRVCLQKGQSLILFLKSRNMFPVLYPIVAAGVGKQVFPKDSLLFHRKK